MHLNGLCKPATPMKLISKCSGAKLSNDFAWDIISKYPPSICIEHHMCVCDLSIKMLEILDFFFFFFAKNKMKYGWRRGGTQHTYIHTYIYIRLSSWLCV